MKLAPGDWDQAVGSVAQGVSVLLDTGYKVGEVLGTGFEEVDEIDAG